LGSLHGVEGEQCGGQGTTAREGGGARPARAMEDEVDGWAEWAERPNRPIGPTGAETEEKFLSA
jgi:hypothetical protein